MTKKPSNLPYLIASAGAVVLIIAAWVGRDLIPTVGPGDKAPSFQAVSLEKRPVALADFEGKVVLVNVWATWCIPCVEEMPSMQRLYETLDGEEFEIVAVSIDAGLGRADESGMVGGDIGDFVKSLGLTFPILHDPDGQIQRIFRTTGVPESFLIGRDGMIYLKVSGPTQWDHPVHIERIRALLGAEP